MKLNELATKGLMGVSYWDIRDAKHAAEYIKRHYPEWDIIFLSPVDYGRRVSGNSISRLSNFDGQMSVYVTSEEVAHGPAMTEAGFLHFVCDTLTMFGEVKALHSIPSDEQTPNTKSFRVEYFNIQHAQQAIARLREAGSGVSPPITFCCKLHRLFENVSCWVMLLCNGC